MRKDQMSLQRPSSASNVTLLSLLLHQPLYFMAFMAFIAGAGAAAAFLAFFIAFMAFMAFGMVKIERVKRLAKRLISQAAKRKNYSQTLVSQMLD